MNGNLCLHRWSRLSARCMAGSKYSRSFVVLLCVPVSQWSIVPLPVVFQRLSPSLYAVNDTIIRYTYEILWMVQKVRIISEILGNHFIALQNNHLRMIQYPVGTFDIVHTGVQCFGNSIILRCPQELGCHVCLDINLHILLWILSTHRVKKLQVIDNWWDGSKVYSQVLGVPFSTGPIACQCKKQRCPGKQRLFIGKMYEEQSVGERFGIRLAKR